MSHWVDKDTLVDENGKQILKGRALTPASVASDGAVSGTTLTASTSSVVTGANGEVWTRGQTTELMTIAAAATSTSVADLLPANSIIEAVLIRVTTIIPTATTFTVGDGTTAARFGTGIAVAAGTTNIGIIQHNTANSNAAGPVQTAAAKIVITPDQTPAANTGRVRVTVFYRTFTAPTA